MKINDIVVKSIVTKGKSGDGMITGLSAEKGEFTSESGDLMLKDSLLQDVNITSTTGDNYVKNVKTKI